MAMLLFDSFRQFTADSGALLVGGSLLFTDPETTLDKTVYADKDLSTPLGAEVTLDAAAKSPTAIWVSGMVNVELLDSSAVQVGLCENMGEDTGGATLPDPADGDEDDVLSTDGVAWLLRAIREYADPTGQGGKYWGSDGELAQWTAFPEAEVFTDDDLPASFTQTNTSSGGFTFGNIRVQWGSDTAPTAASVLTTKAVTFGVAFSGTPYTVQVTPTSGGVTSDTPSGRCSAQAISANTTGFTASLFAGAEDEGSGSTNITSTVAFTWFAVGPK